MPTIKEMRTLYSLCLDIESENIFNFLNDVIREWQFRKGHKYYVNIVPGIVRQHLINFTMSKDKYPMQYLLDLIRLLGDSGITKLWPSANNFTISCQHYKLLIDYLRENKCTGLVEFIARVRYEQNDHMRTIIVEASRKFSSLLYVGLGENLRVLVLHRVCDNGVLRSIGLHCKRLIHLDVSSSWLVDDDGFKCLLFKDLIKLPLPNIIEELELPNLLKISDDLLNPCCFSLEDIRIQDTNSTILSVVLLLIHVKRLKSMGGFIYYRNVGDALALLSRNFKFKEPLNLRELWDTNLPEQKLNSLIPLIPNLTSLYTRVMYLIPGPSPFKFLSSLIIDFDYKSYEDSFMKYLEYNGANLEKLSLIDQKCSIDMTDIMMFCPRLKEFSGLVTVRDTNVEMPELYKVSLKMDSWKSLYWIFQNAPNLEIVNVFILFHVEESYLTEYNRFFVSVLRNKVRCSDTLHYLNIRGPMNKASGYKILQVIDSLPKLKFFGDFKSFSILPHEFKKLQDHINYKKYDIFLIRDGQFIPYLDGSPYQFHTWNQPHC